MFEARIEPGFQSWRNAARAALRMQIEPTDLLWNDGSAGTLSNLAEPLPAAPISANDAASEATTVPREFMSLANMVAHHRDAGRWPLLYRILFRLTHGEPRLLEVSVDDEVRALREMDKSVRRDLHKMHAFVRFRRVKREDNEHFIAFHKPDHLIMPLAAPWFAKRFAVMHWTILTPDASATWDGQTLRYGPGASKSPVDTDDLEQLWRVYYGSVFNPARIKIGAMKKEMPVRHWKTLPETQVIDDLLRDAPKRVEQMMLHAEPAGCGETRAAVSAEPFVPKTTELPVLREAVRSCKGCDLYRHATQPVFGQGPAGAIAMFVGEQPGDQEDLAGKPFVGPAGQVLDEALAKAGIERGACYVTNAVKHFKFEPRGKRRIHAKPSAREVASCRPWLEAEIQSVRPRMIIALGATAAQSLLGPQFRLMQNRGRVFTDTRWASWFMATIHPSALLRIPDPDRREEAYQQFISDLRMAAQQINSFKVQAA